MTNRFNHSEKSTKHFVKSQFPDFFLTEGEGIVDFVDQYYRHFSANTGYKVRDIQFQGDIDTTSDLNLIRFNNKYTFGSGRFIKELPAVITGDLRFIIKHIKDLYRSKGSKRGIKLFFRLAFNDSPEIFVPGTFLFKASDSVFRRPNIIEIRQGDGNNFQDLINFQGTEIVGSVTGASATVADVFVKKVGKKEFIYFALESLNGVFKTGDKITARGADRLTVANAPKVIGPVDQIIVKNGSENIPLGTEFTALPREDGVELKASTVSVRTKRGTFLINDIAGYGYSDKSTVIVTRTPQESTNITRGSFSVVVNDLYSTHSSGSDLFKTFEQQQIGTATVNGIHFANTAGPNGSVTALSDIFKSRTSSYGNILRLDINEEPNDYAFKPFVAVKEISFTANLSGSFTIANTKVTASEPVFGNTLIHVANTLSGNVEVAFGNNKVTGNGTSFTSDFSNYDVIKIMDFDGLPNFFNIRSVDSDTVMTLTSASELTMSGREYGKGFVNYIKIMDVNGDEIVRAVNNYVDDSTIYLDDIILSTELAVASSYPAQLGYNTSNVNFSSINDPIKKLVQDGVTFINEDTGTDAEFDYNILTAQNSVKEVTILNSGFGYIPGDDIIMRSEDITPIINISGGGGTGAIAIPSLSGGQITSVLITNGGSGYTSNPSVTVEGGTGSGAVLTSTVVGGSVVAINVNNAGTNYFPTKDIIVRPVKGGQSILEGRHLSLNSELNTHLKIQDNDYWQEYSYEIKSNIDSEKYEKIVDELIHMSGRKFFTKNLIKDDTVSSVKILEESVTAVGT